MNNLDLSITANFLKRKATLVRTLALLLAFSSFSSLIMGVVVFFLISGPGPIWILVITGIGLIFYLSSYLVVRKNATPLRVKISTYMTLLTLLGVVSLVQVLLGSGGSAPGPFLMVPVLAGLCGLSRKEVIVFTLLTAALLGTFYTLGKITVSYTPVLDLELVPGVLLFTWILVLVMLTVAVTVFIQQLSTANNLLLNQAQQLRELLASKTNSVELGTSLIQRTNHLTAETKATSSQQASRSQEQAAAVSQVSTSILELSRTAEQIADNSQKVADSANQTLEFANQVREAGELATQIAVDGNDAVIRTGVSISRLNERIEILAHQALRLTAQTDQVGTVINIMKEIAEETHLLALNASIEAAGGVLVGTGGNGGGKIHSERFGVIAQEVKGLSDRSRSATEEVETILVDIQGAVAALVLTSEEARKETASTLAQSKVAGEAIGQLKEAIGNNTSKAAGILTSIATIRERCEEIGLATNQQQSANSQIVATMQGLAEISKESAMAISHISSAVSQVDSEVQTLNSILVGA